MKTRSVSPASRTLFDIDAEYAAYGRAAIVVIPAPYEGTVTYGRGTARGPAAIFDASSQVELYDILLEREPYRAGIHMLPALKLPESAEGAIRAVRSAAEKVLDDGKLPALIGGEHSLTLGAVQACLERYPELSVLQLDAHADLRTEYQGTPFSHACVMRRIADMKVPFVPVGIRSMCREESDWIKRKKQKVFYAHSIKGRSAWIKDAVSRLSDYVYLTLDLDVLDPSEMPATGTPEPGGLSFYEVVNLCDALAKSGRGVVGFDIMELAPIKNLKASDFLAAKLLYHLIGLFQKEQPAKSKPRLRG